MKNRYIYIVLFLTSYLTGCVDTLTIEPRQSVNSNIALDSPEGIDAAIASCYVMLKAQALYGRDLLAISECLADNVRVVNRAGGRFVNEAGNVINAHIGGWNTYYNGINQVNLLLEALPKSSFPQKDKDTREGELKFLRALFYFNLSRIYAHEPKRTIVVSKEGVVLQLKGVRFPSEITYPKRSTTEEIYTQMYQDLTDAVAKAPTGGGPNRATKGAAQALFACVALYNKDWENAAKYAEDAINSKVGRLVTKDEYVAAWRNNSNPESLFEVLFQSRQESLGVNNSLQSAYTTLSSVKQAQDLLADRPTDTKNLPPANGWGAVVPTTAFLALYTTDDVRGKLYQLGLSRSSSITTECTKFLGKSGVLYMDNIPVFRISEMYLIRAEARARIGQSLDDALADVNLIRTRAGLTARTGLTQQQLIDEIMLQRRLELAFEGQRWFDLKRLEMPLVKGTVTMANNDIRRLAPIPNSEILANKNLVQNAGY